VFVVTDSDFVCFVVIKARAEGSSIPEVVAVAVETATGEAEVVVPLAGVPEVVVLDLEASVAPEITKGVHVHVL
jgi:hypothetical protein